MALNRLSWGMVLGICACSGAEAGSNPNGTPLEAGTPVQVTASERVQQALNALAPQLEQPESFAELSAAHPFTPSALTSYDPNAALHLDLIQASWFPLSPAELEVLGQRGFVISESQTFPTFGAGFAAIYSQDLPIYVSADAILEGVHRSYDAILKLLEEQSLATELSSLLTGLRMRLPGANIDPVVAKDLDFYLAVPLGLLQGRSAPPVAGASAEQIRRWTQAAVAAEAHQPMELFGAAQDVDFSQFKPRGHYTASETLERFFRAMMWLGRIELRLIETSSDGSRVFRRRPFDAMLAISTLLDEGSTTSYRRLDDTYRNFVGASDNMTLDDVARLKSELGITGSEGAGDLEDAALAAVISRGGYGEQSIASQLMINGTADLHTLPLNRSFLLLGQRYTLDSHVFSNVVFDRVAPTPTPRMMPEPLDIAFAALGNNQALGLLESEIETYHYAPALGQMRVLADAHGDDFWSGSLYNLWLSALRELSPKLDGSEPAGAGMPELTGTDAWGRRLLDAQLGSWAELRRDNVLVVKQSTSSGISCEYPDAYVDPYPDFFARLGAFAEKGEALATSFGSSEVASRVSDYFQKLRQTLLTLQQMAENQRAGTPFDAAQMAFINRAVTASGVCGGPPMLGGWYADLYFATDKALDFDPTIADVHTQFTDEAGIEVGRVLHVATGSPRLMVVTVNSCNGPRAYAGVAFAYHQLTLDNWQRMNDEEWKAKLSDASYTAPNPGWLAPALAP